MVVERSFKVYFQRAAAQLSVANRAVHQRVDIGLKHVIFGPSFLIFPLHLAGVPIPIEMSDVLLGPQVWPRIAMATDTPRHRQFLGLIDRLHLIDPSVTGLATHPGG